MEEDPSSKAPPNQKKLFLHITALLWKNMKGKMKKTSEVDKKASQIKTIHNQIHNQTLKRVT